MDLVDTRWIDDTGTHDLLDDPEQVAGWLERHGLGGPTAATVTHLRKTRQAIIEFLEAPADASSRTGLDGILGHGRLLVTAEPDGPLEHLEAPAAWRAAWLAARELLELRAAHPERIKHCANPDCVLWFLDTTRSGTRRWCSMTRGCGSKLKARRHQHRTRAVQ